VNFVRINGNLVIGLEIAAVGKPLVTFTKDEVEGMMRTDGTPLIPGDEPHTRTVAMGDVVRNPDTQAAAAPPSLRKPGETLPADTTATDATGRVGVMKPVQFPKEKPDDKTNATPDSQPAAAKPSGQATPDSSTPPGNAQPPPAKPAPGSSQPQ
jgi:hypothetical protein